MKIKIIILLVILSFSSCRSRKISVETHSTDTIYKSEVIKIDKPQLSTIVLENICDSLGVLRPIFYTNTSDNVKATLKSDNNTLRFEVNVDSIVNSKVNEYKSSLKTKETVVTKYKIPKWCWYNLIYSILATLFIFRKPLLKLINPLA